VDVAQIHRFPECLQAPRQPLADALGIAVGVVVVWRGGHGGSLRELSVTSAFAFECI
jgi:hypothetical protein